ncbi:MAG: response regulator, partial [Verrucomicrobiota bacterium]
VVTSEEGKGTVFTAFIPRQVPDQALTSAPFAAKISAAAAPSPQAPKAASQAPFAGAAAVTVAADAPLVLVVDDDPGVIDILSRNLLREGYRVRSALNGPDALALARELQPRLVTLDVMMPSMDGWSVLTSLKADPLTRAIPVVMISIVDDKQLGFSLGAADYLTKPIDRTQLAEILAKHVSHAADRLALVVDDLPDNREILRNALEREGWSVMEAENGRAALNLFLDHKPALILLDLMMPVMDGFEFLRELRASDAGHSVPVVVVTAKELTPEERTMLRTSVENIVQKGTVSHDSWIAEVREKTANLGK